jgi:hypothetical protein
MIVIHATDCRGVTKAWAFPHIEDVCTPETFRPHVTALTNSVWIAPGTLTADD